jgi:hypothetical protein
VNREEHRQPGQPGTQHHDGLARPHDSGDERLESPRGIWLESREWASRPTARPARPRSSRAAAPQISGDGVVPFCSPAFAIGRPATSTWTTGNRRRAARSGPARAFKRAPARGSGDDDLAGTRAHTSQPRTAELPRGSVSNCASGRGSLPPIRVVYELLFWVQGPSRRASGRRPHALQAQHASFHFSPVISGCVGARNPLAGGRRAFTG